MAPPKPFDPKDPSTWPKLDPKRLAELQAKAGYKPLTGKKPTGTPVQPDTNMYNAGTMDVLRGAGNALIKAGDFVFKEPAKSLARTLSTQNIQTALNPRSTATQRINAIGEDALNILSIVPAFRVGGAVDDAIRYADESKAAVKQAYTNFRNRKAPINSSWLHGSDSYFAPARAMTANREMFNADSELQLLISQGKIRPERQLQNSGQELFPYGLQVEDTLEPGYERFWHTTPKGEKLPEKLHTMRDAARIETRRGTGSSQLLSGGLYGTNGRGISGTYFTEFDNPEMGKFLGSVLPETMVDDWLAVPAVYEQNWRQFADVDPEIFRSIRKMQIDDYNRQMVNLDDPASKLSLFQHPGFADSDKTVRQILNEAPTEEHVRDILNRIERPIVYRPQKKPRNDLTDSVQNEIANFERLQFKYPIVKNPDGTFSNTAIVSPGTNLYLTGDQSYIPRMPFSQEYFDEMLKLEQEWTSREMQKFIDSGLAFDEYKTRALIEQKNPYATFRANQAKPTFRSERLRQPGQNYFDLPVVRNEAGTIESIGGLRAIDIDSADPAVFKNVANEIQDFLQRTYPQVAQSPKIKDVVERIRNLAESKIRTTEFARAIGELDAALTPDNIDFTSLTPKEQIYQDLADKGYGVIPHTGGQVTSGTNHLAVNFLKPEDLPPAKYIGDKDDEIKSLINKIARQKAIQMRSVNSKMTAAPYNEAMFKAALDRVRKEAGRTALQSIASSNLRRIGGY